MSGKLTTVAVVREHDVVLARQRARQITVLLDFDYQDQARVATAVSELARNAFEYAGGGRVEFALSGAAEPELVVRVIDQGPGIAELDAVLQGRGRSKTGMGLGIVGARRLMDRFEITSSAGAGTTVLVAKRLPAGRLPLSAEIASINDALARQVIDGPLGELQLQNQELVHALDELQERQVELGRLNHELEETNRGVVALYAELEERAEELRRASDSKSRFLSNVSHELRTPLSSILALNDLLLSRVDGPLTGEQQRQVQYTRDTADGLLGLVNELLDLASIEAGKTNVNLETFPATDLFSSLRGMFRSLHRNDRVALVFDDPSALAPLHTDQSKLSQILRNFISNALKFTESGEVRLSARADQRTGTVSFAVTDTGIGLAPEDLERVFEEFVQIDGKLQQRRQGTGLGLPVSRRLAERLGGTVTVESTPDSGSTFTVVIPAVYCSPESVPGRERRRTGALEGRRVLVVDDEESARYIACRALAAQGCDVVEAADGRAGVRAAREELPDAIVLDLNMAGGDGLSALRQLRADAAVSTIPVIIYTGRRLTADERARLEEDADAVLDKHHSGGEQLAATVAQAIAQTVASP